MSDDVKLLHLNLKGSYYDAILSGEKKEEYRLYNAYWKKRILGKVFGGVLIKRGYPKREDNGLTIFAPWRGFSIKTIKHDHFGSEPVKVFAIRVNE